MQKVPMLDEDNNKIEVEIKSWDDKNIFYLSYNGVEWIKGKLVWFSKKYDWYIGEHGESYNYCRQISKRIK